MTCRKLGSPQNILHCVYAFLGLWLAMCPGAFSQDVLTQTAIKDQQQHYTASGLVYRNCEYRDIPSSKVSCASFTTDAQRGKFTLPVAIIHASKKVNDNSNQKSKEALVFIPGGPGEGFQVTEANIEYWLDWMDSAQLTRDLILFDPRGTGQSQPQWQCDEYDRKSVEWAAENLDQKAELQLSYPVLAQCLAEFQDWLTKNVIVEGTAKAPIKELTKGPKNTSATVPTTEILKNAHREIKNDVQTETQSTMSGRVNIRQNASTHPGLALFSTINQAQDINDLLTALGYRSWHLWGVSYGTRVALLAGNAAQVQSLILDSPYPLDKGTLSEWPALLDNALQLHAEIYQQLFRKQGKYADFHTLWRKVLEKIEISPPVFQVETWLAEAEKPYTLVLNKDRLIALAYYVLYDTNLWWPFYQGLEAIESAGSVSSNNVPKNNIIKNVYRNLVDVFNRATGTPSQLDYLNLILESFMTTVFDPNFGNLIFFTVECIDNPLEPESSYRSELAKYPFIAPFAQHDWNFDICREKIFDQRRVVASQILPHKPTLIVNGQYDPVTPIAWGKSLSQQMGDNASFHVVKGMGHGVTIDDVCDLTLFEQFMDRKAVNLAEKCVDVDLSE